MTVSYHWAPMPNAFVAVDTTEDGIVISKGHYLNCEDAASLLTAKEAQVESLTLQIDELKAQLSAVNTVPSTPPEGGIESKGNEHEERSDTAQSA